MYIFNLETRNENYVGQVLSSSYEGSFLLAAYEFEQDEEKLANLLEKKKFHIFRKTKSQNW